MRIRIHTHYTYAAGILKIWDWNIPTSKIIVKLEFVWYSMESWWFKVIYALLQKQFREQCAAPELKTKAQAAQALNSQPYHQVKYSLLPSTLYCYPRCGCLTSTGCLAKVSVDGSQTACGTNICQGLTCLELYRLFASPATIGKMFYSICAYIVQRQQSDTHSNTSIDYWNAFNTFNM